MSQELEQLIEKARNGGDYEFNQLVQALAAASYSDPDRLVNWLRSPDDLIRRAALRAARLNPAAQVIEAVLGLVNDPVAFVRESLALLLIDATDWPADGVLLTLTRDVDQYVRQAAIRAAVRRPQLEGQLVQLLRQEEDRGVRYTIAQSLNLATPQVALPALLERLAQDSDAGVREASAATSEALLVRARNAGLRVLEDQVDLLLLGKARKQLRTITYATFPNLQTWLDGHLTSFVDVEEIQGFGAILNQEVQSLPHAYNVNTIVDEIIKILSGAPPRAVVLLGESGCGKTAIVNELVHRLHNYPRQPWTVLRMSPQEFLAGTKWVGEWETQVRNLVNAIKTPRRVLLYIPNLQELAWVGTTSSSQGSVASALAPHIEGGEITVLGESGTEAFRKGLGANPSLRRLFQAIELPEASPKEVREIVQAVVAETRIEMPEPVLERLLDLADYYATSAVQPGRTVGLLRRVLAGVGNRPGPITDRDILTTLSTATGIPLSFLDDQQALDRNKVREFFEARVMGQPEAVDAVVDLVTLVKAGLTDPGKPLGVFLFVGPTGVGKTELARALAELLFGDAGRLVRFDMSEFATYEAYERLIGQGAWSSGQGQLTAAVKERPFAVLLFDEIEKAHPNIYNLCLQIFDAGRLTDTQGRTADFRKTIIIMTSNVGAGQQKLGGFGQPAVQSSSDRDSILRELGRWFRPEFLNRLDRIVTFQPLSDQTAEAIARREVDKALKRSGITRRRLVVDVDPSVLQLLLREGYSPTFGARPLKRTVERRVLLPLAQAIATGQAPSGSTVRLETRQDRVVCVVAEPEDEESTFRMPAPAARAMPVARRAEQLAEMVRTVQEQAAPLAAQKSELLARAAEPGFWDQQPAARRLQDRVYRLDAILGGLADLDKRLRSEREDAQRLPAGESGMARIEERLDQIESELRHLAFLVGQTVSQSGETQQLADAYVTLRLVNSQGPGLDGVLLLARMYQGLAKRWRLEVEVLDDRRGGDPVEDTIVLVISGAGAYALLAGETGLHQLARGRREIVGGRKRYAEREVVRVEVLPVPDSEIDIPSEALRIEVRPLHDQSGRLLQRVKHEVHLFHVPTMTAVRAWTDGARYEAIERLKPLLQARLEAAARAQPEVSQRPALVRRYTLGPTTLVRDLRSGRCTGRLNQVLEGKLEMFLTPPSLPV